MPARAAGTPFLGSAVRKEQSSVLDLAQAMGSWVKATAGTGLTIRSSRARFAASCNFLQVSLAQGRKAARLNSGVRAHWYASWLADKGDSGAICVRARNGCAARVRGIATWLGSYIQLHGRNTDCF